MAAAERRQLRYHFFKTFMFTQLKSGSNATFSYGAVSRSTRDRDLKTYEAVFVPINVADNHWILGVVCPQRWLVEGYDSMGVISNFTMSFLVKWAKNECEAHGRNRGACWRRKMECRK